MFKEENGWRLSIRDATDLQHVGSVMVDVAATARRVIPGMVSKLVQVGQKFYF